MFLRDGQVITSASDLTIASKCEFAFLRALDAKLGRVPAVIDPEDAMRDRAASLGDQHEAEVLEHYRNRFPGAVVEIPRPDLRDPTSLPAALAHTSNALSSGAEVVFQAAFAHEDFLGFADFLVRRPDGSYLVQDTKLARRARVTALLQLAAYAEQLDRLGVRRADTVELLLGDGTVSEHQLGDILPVYRLRRRRLQHIIAERLAATGPVQWGDPRYFLDGHCPTCDLEVQAHHDILLVAGMRLSHRAALREAGITTIHELAASGQSTGKLAPTSMAQATLAGLQAQARLQLRGELNSVPPVEIRDAHVLSAIPEPNPGDLFFDFEGDPLYTEGTGRTWGLDYLFGLTNVDDEYTPVWAHSFAEERVALEKFLAMVHQRRQAYPGLHIYHYASYERSHLLAIAARHGVGEAEVDQLLADGVLVDLYPIVRHAIRVGSRSYSIKKLEPLYMGTELRTSDVVTGSESITQYVHARELAAAGEAGAARRLLDDLADYNRYDCVSTRRLRDWLLDRAREAGVQPAWRPEEPRRIYQSTPLAEELLRQASSGAGSGTGSGAGPRPAQRSPDQAALALAAAAIDYHDREQKSFWWGHFFRLEQPIEEWENTREVIMVDPLISETVRPWFRQEGQRRDRRHLALRGRIAPGSRLSVGANFFALYDPSGPLKKTASNPGTRVPSPARVLEVYDDGVLVEEICSSEEHWSGLPVALVPGPPPNAGAQRTAIAEWAAQLLHCLPTWPRDAATDILRRQSPAGFVPDSPAFSQDATGTTVRALLSLDNSYLAVQGPPGTGKTYLAAQVIAELVTRECWRVGVVAQSHAVVEHLLDQVVAAGVPGDLVAKAPKDPLDPGKPEYTLIAKDAVAAFCTDHGESGYVAGGTAWDFSNLTRFPRRGLDLLVIDEAGQFSLAQTLAVAVAARNLLLLGDPSQLPQVSQGVHPEPVDESALGWVSGSDVLPSQFGYFLAESRRMHPELVTPVSILSYQGALRSHPGASARSLAGIQPGLIPVPVVHSGNSTESLEEARQVVILVRDLLGRAWSEGNQQRPLEPRDIIVVTPYNAQLTRIRAQLDAAGFATIPVGTVDKFQGQEAAIAIVSLATSSAIEAPRGIQFLLLKNRLNVAISRAKWAAYLLYSPALLDHLPHTPEGVAQLSGFARLVGAG